MISGARILPVLLCTAFAAVSTAPAAFAQSLSFVGADSDNPIDVYARDGIEWQRKKNLFIARGDAKATQNDVTVTAAKLIARYRSGEEGNETDIYRLDAVGGVTITSPRETARGETAAYDLDQEIMVLEGGDVSLTTEDSLVTAKDRLEFWEVDRVAVARGKASATREGRTIHADVLTAKFRPEGEDGSTGKDDSISLIEAFGNVAIQTGEETAYGDKGYYDLDQGMATLQGNVRVEQGRNRMTGGFAVVDMNEGISTLYGGPADAGVRAPNDRARARAVVYPGETASEPDTKTDNTGGNTDG